MTITESPRPTRNGPVALTRGFLTSGVIGASLAALVVGGVIENVPLFCTGLGLPIAYGALYSVAGRPRRARAAAAVPRTALAMIESLHATGAELSADVPIRFVLSVAPDDGPAYRVEITQDINLVDVPGYRPRGIVVVEYPQDRPWRVRIVKRPTPEWERRAAGALLDSAPESAVVERPPEGCAFGIVLLVGLLLGAAAVILSFRADLFGNEATARPPAAARPSTSSTSSTSSSITVTSSAGLATVALGPDRTLLDKGELRRAVDSLTQGKDTSPVLSVVVQEHLMSVVYAPTGTAVPGFGLRSLPYERLPALVEEAVSTLGVRSPRTWQLSVDHLTGALVIRVTVTSPDGGASLDADAKGRVVRRNPAR
ncbi:hypothetical protein [Streptomyces sp. NPDC096311]|uniref:hypothetical protein n=1 Tax=Streptomyces sp. NPDC096311 TaxID=3366083 RepID=UPI0037F18998